MRLSEITENAEWEAILARTAKTKRDAQAYAAAGKPAKFRGDHITYLVSKDLDNPPDGWRVTMFGSDGQPTGHWEAKNAYEAFREVLAGSKERIGPNHLPEAMRLSEISVPGNRRHAITKLMFAGYKLLGPPGAFGAVLRNPSASYCLKLFSPRDKAYLSYLDLIKSHRNPHFPRTFGKLLPIKEPEPSSRDPKAILAMMRDLDINDPAGPDKVVYYAIRLEILEENRDEAYRWVSAITDYLDGDKQLEAAHPAMAQAVNLVEQLGFKRDYKPNNILFRGDVPVLIDPITR